MKTRAAGLVMAGLAFVLPGVQAYECNINCGGPAYTAVDRTEYLADQAYTPENCAGFAGGNTGWTSLAISGTPDPVLYQTERWGSFEYTFDAPNGLYDVTLQFVEFAFNAVGARVFSVWIEGNMVITNRDMYQEAGKCVALDHTFVTEVKDGQLNIQAQASADQPQLSALRVKSLVTPSPQELALKGFDVTIDAAWRIAVDTSSSNGLFAAEQLQDDLSSNYGLILAVVDTATISGGEYIVLANPGEDSSVQDLCLQRELTPGSELGEEGYLLEVFSDEMIIVSANYPQGVFYGMQTIRQLLTDTGAAIIARAAKVKDWPDNRMRGMHFCGINFTSTHDDYVYDKIDKMAEYKMNTAVFEAGYYDLQSNSAKRDRLIQLFDYCRQRHIEPAPDLDNWSNGSQVTGKDLNLAEGVWIKDEPFVFVNGVATAVALKDLEVTNPGFEEDGDADGMPDGWKIVSYPEGLPVPIAEDEYWTRDATVKHSGNYSMKLSSGDATVTSSSLQSELVTVEPTTLYTLSCFAKKTTGSSGSYNLAVRVSQYRYTDKWEYIVENHYGLTSVDWWDEHSLNFYTDQSCTAVKIWVWLYNGHGSAWVDDLKLERMNGCLANVLKTDETGIRVTSLDKTRTYAEGTDYEVITGNLAHTTYLLDPAISPTEIVRIDGGGIGTGETVLVSYDLFVQFHHLSWKRPYCPSDPRTYEVISNAFTDVCTYLYPKSISIKLDEVCGGMNRDSRCLSRNLENWELFGDGINRLYDCIRGIDPQVRIMMWDDMINPWHNGARTSDQKVYGGKFGTTYQAIDLIPTDIVQIVWWYSANDSREKMKNSPDYFTTNGFNYLASPWYDEKNIRMWADILRQRKDALGMIDTAWPDSPSGMKWKGLVPTADYAWCYKALPYAVASSSESFDLQPANAVDGNPSTRWSSQFSDPQWIYIDFAQPKTFDAVALHWETAYAKEYRIEVSDDAQNWTAVCSETNGNGGADIFEVGNRTARYVRMYGIKRATPWGYSLWEFEVLSCSPIAYWPMDENAGAILHDETYNHNDGDIVGASWTSGISGSALSFDGMDDYVTVPSSSSLSTTGDITVEAWGAFLESTAQKGNSQYLLKKENAFKLGTEYQTFPNDEFEIQAAGHEGTPAVDTTTAQRGSASAKFIRTSLGSSSIRTRYIDLTGINSITMHGYCRAENVVQGPNGWEKLVWIGRWYDENKNMIPNNCPDLGFWDGTFDWTLREATLSVPPEARYYRILALGLEHATGTGWWDDVRITDQDGNTLFYSSFEHDDVWFKVRDPDPDVGWVGMPVGMGSADFAHYGGTWDGDFITVYKDGVESGSIRHPSSIAASGDDLVIGEGLHGVVDELRIYDRALAGEEIDDVDADGMPDWWESQYGFSPINPEDGGEDPDGDGLVNLDEYLNGTNPLNIDTDGDGKDDRFEVANGSNPVDEFPSSGVNRNWLFHSNVEFIPASEELVPGKLFSERFLSGPRFGKYCFHVLAPRNLALGAGETAEVGVRLEIDGSPHWIPGALQTSSVLSASRPFHGLPTLGSCTLDVYRIEWTPPAFTETTYCPYVKVLDASLETVDEAFLLSANGGSGGRLTNNWADYPQSLGTNGEEGAYAFQPYVHPNGSNVIVLYNSNWTDDSNGDGVQDSKEVALYYAQKRSVPAGNLLGVGLAFDTPGTYGVMSQADFHHQILTNLSARIESLDREIYYIAVCYGIPVFLSMWTERPSFALDGYLIDMQGNLGSFDGTNYSGVGPAGGAITTHHAFARSSADPDYSRRLSELRHIDPATYTIYLPCRIDGPTPEIAKGLVDKALYAERYLQDGGGETNSPYHGIALSDDMYDPTYAGGLWKGNGYEVGSDVKNLFMGMPMMEYRTPFGTGDDQLLPWEVIHDNQNGLVGSGSPARHPRVFGVIESNDTVRNTTILESSHYDRDECRTWYGFEGRAVTNAEGTAAQVVEVLTGSRLGLDDSSGFQVGQKIYLEQDIHFPLTDVLWHSSYYEYYKHYDIMQWPVGAVSIQHESWALGHFRNIKAANYGNRALARGVTAIAGAIAEPYFNCLANADLMFSSLAQGYPWAEAVHQAYVWSGSGMQRWVNMAVGDPLYAPFRGLWEGTTVPDMTPPSIVSIKSTPAGYGSGEVTLSAELGSDTYEQSVDVALFKLEYGTTTNYGNVIDYIIWNDPNDVSFDFGRRYWYGRRLSETLTNLAEGAYHCRIWAKDPYGNETYSAHYQFWTFVNEDRDVLPDGWEQQIVDADPNDAIETVYDVLADDDFDDDGVRNGDEYQRGTDPCNPPGACDLTLAARYPLDENGGQVAHDWTTNHNDGTVSGAAWTQGVSKSALYFDGVDDRVSVPSAASLSITGEITVAASGAFSESTAQKGTSQYLVKKEGAFKLGTEYQDFPNDEFKGERGGHSGTPAADTNTAAHGSDSTKFVRTTLGNSSLISRYIDLTGVTSIKLQGYNKADNVVKGPNSWEMLGWFGRWHDENKTQLSDCPDLGCWQGTFDWTLREKTLSVPQGARYYRILALGLEQCIGTGWWDDVGITDQDGNTLFYSSFEHDDVWFKVRDPDPDVGWVGMPIETASAEFTHYAGRWDGGFITVYRNGVASGSIRHPSSIAASVDDLLIGDGLEGTLDEVKIYHRALTQGQMRDMDEDGLPDYWEYENGLDFTSWDENSNGIVDADDDFDNDGASNLDECLCGSNPLDQHRVLRLEAAWAGEHTDGFVIRWSSVSNESYTVYRSANLPGEFDPIVTNLPATPPVNVYTDVVQGAGPYYYRLKAKKAAE